jgi:hypothetical protein
MFTLALIMASGITALDVHDAKSISMKDGMYYCPALDTYIKPDSKDIGECAFADQAQKICLANNHTDWISGRCFCPEKNIYLQTYDYYYTKDILNNPNEYLKNLFFLVKDCPRFKPRKNPFSRTVMLEPNLTHFIVTRVLDSWDSRDDVPGDQGNPHFSARITDFFGINLGFGFDSNKNPVVPSFETLNSLVQKLDKNISFFEFAGKLTGRVYLENFIKGQLPVSRITNNGDATYFLHDLSFHAASLLLLPPKILMLAQKQTYYLLDFVDSFKSKYPSKYSQPNFKLMLKRLIQDQIDRIDSATGLLELALFDWLHDESYQDFVEFLSNLDRSNLARYSSVLTRIICSDFRFGFSELRSVKEFLLDKKYLVLRAFDDSDKKDIKFFMDALFAYIKEQNKKEFVEEIELDFFDDPDGQELKYLSKPTAVDLFIERIESLREASELMPRCKK